MYMYVDTHLSGRQLLQLGDLALDVLDLSQR